MVPIEDIRTQRIGHLCVSDSSKCNRTYGFGLTKLDNLSLEWLRAPKRWEKIFTHPLTGELVSAFLCVFCVICGQQRSPQTPQITQNQLFFDNRSYSVFFVILPFFVLFVLFVVFAVKLFVLFVVFVVFVVKLFVLFVVAALPRWVFCVFSGSLRIDVDLPPRRNILGPILY